MWDDIQESIRKLHILILGSHESSDEGTAMLNELFRLTHLISEFKVKHIDRSDYE